MQSGQECVLAWTKIITKFQGTNRRKQHSGSCPKNSKREQSWDQPRGADGCRKQLHPSFRLCGSGWQPGALLPPFPGLWAIQGYRKAQISAWLQAQPAHWTSCTTAGSFMGMAYVNFKEDLWHMAASAIQCVAMHVHLLFLRSPRRLFAADHGNCSQADSMCCFCNFNLVYAYQIDVHDLLSSESYETFTRNLVMETAMPSI